MKSYQRCILICALPSLLAGCSEFYGSQPPAPVFEGQAKNQKPSAISQKKSKHHAASAKEIVKTQPLKEYSAFKQEVLPIAEPPHLEATTIPTTPMPTSAVPSEAQESVAIPTQTAPSPVPHESASVPPDTAIAEQQPIPQPSTQPEATAFVPMEATSGLSPAVNALVVAANQNTKAGDLDLAASSLERAIRIEPRNANLFYKLALLRLKQGKPRLAEDLAKKSALLAATDNKLKKNCWLLIAHVREMQQNIAGAKEARTKADSF